jgi:hypothetical protein
MLNILNIAITPVQARADLQRDSVLDMEISLPLLCYFDDGETCK